jgi:hypothetical protein
MKSPILLQLFFLSFIAASCANAENTSGDASEDVAFDVQQEDVSGDPTGDCPPGLRSCGGACVDTDTDHENCGACSSPCEPAQVCSEGECLIECPSGKTSCSGGCVDLLTDIYNCGSCGNACTAGRNAEPACRSGSCAVVCDEGWADLDGDGNCDDDCVPTSPVEICNGLDDNCNGQRDETFSCIMGTTVACTTSCGSTGSGACSSTCQLPGPSACSPPPETCNGADDDCDYQCDDGYTCCLGTSEACTNPEDVPGTRQCGAACTWSDCCAAQEVCGNDYDDDCDGATDEAGCVDPVITVTISRSPATSTSSPFVAGNSTTFYFNITPWPWVRDNVASIRLRTVTRDVATGEGAEDPPFDMGMSDIVAQGMCNESGSCSTTGTWQASQFDCGGVNTSHVRSREEWLEILTTSSNHTTFYFQCSDM